MMAFHIASPTFLQAGRQHHTGARPITGDWKFPHHGWCLIVILLLLAGVCAAKSPDPTIAIGKATPPVEIVRCHFDEGRIVLRLGDDLHVLRKGDTIESIGLRLVEVASGGATISIRQKTPNKATRLIRITDTGAGTLLMREFATDPAGLSSSPPQPPAASTTRIDQSPKGPGED